MFSNIPVKKLSTILWLGLGAFSLNACTQMTKHSNMLVFATNTVVGVKIGQDVNQTPTLDIGYNRQETAFVPVLANTNVQENGDLEPCSTSTGAMELKDCHFRATHDGVDGDAYSTLASFGASGKASKADSSSGEIRLAQYFATGIAAQHLALSGGANVVQAGGDSAAIANAAKAVSDLEKARLQSAATYVTDIEAGKLIAKSILGSSNQGVATDKRQDLASKMGTGCDDSYLSGLDQTTVASFLAALESDRFPCLRKLGADAKK